jgi:hypothetical protein
MCVINTRFNFGLRGFWDISYKTVNINQSLQCKSENGICQQNRKYNKSINDKLNSSYTQRHNYSMYGLCVNALPRSFYKYFNL